MLEEPAVPREGRSMSGGRIWRIGAPVVAFIASGGVALLVGIVVAMPIDLLMDRKRSLFSALPRLRRWGGWRSKGYQRPLVCSRSNTIVIRNSPPARSSTLAGSRATPAVAAFGSSATFTGAASHLSSTVLDLRMAEVMRPGHPHGQGSGLETVADGPGRSFAQPGVRVHYDLRFWLGFGWVLLYLVWPRNPRFPRVDPNTHNHMETHSCSHSMGIHNCRNRDNHN